jgi:hypothetical protein
VLFLIPPLCLLAAGFAPIPKKWLIAILCVAFAVKAGLPSRTWGLPFGSYPQLPAEARLRAYSDRARPNSLVLVNSDDELYSAALPLSKIYYCWIDASGLVQRLAPHYVELGITVTAAQFDQMPQLEPGFRDRLRDWGLDSNVPIATAVVAESDADIAGLIATHPTMDFYLPARFRGAFEGLPTHDIAGESGEYFFLLARQRPEASPPLAQFKAPANW